MLIKVPVHASSLVCVHVRAQVTCLHVFVTICVRELVCTPTTVHVRPSWVCKRADLHAFMPIYESMANCQCVCVCVCAGDTIPMCAWVRTCLFGHVLLCLCSYVWDREDMRGCGRALQEGSCRGLDESRLCRVGTLGEVEQVPLN